MRTKTITIQPFAYIRAFCFVAFWMLILTHLFVVGMQKVIIPAVDNWSAQTFQVVAFAPTVRKTVVVKPIEKPIVVHQAVTTKLIPTKKDIIFSQKHGDIIFRIWGLESSFGQEPFLYCTRQGKISDMGYNVLNHQCFDSFTQEVTTVEGWLESHEGMPLGQELCLYNTGKVLGCEYEINFLSL